MNKWIEKFLLLFCRTRRGIDYSPGLETITEIKVLFGKMYLQKITHRKPKLRGLHADLVIKDEAAGFSDILSDIKIYDKRIQQAVRKPVWERPAFEDPLLFKTIKRRRKKK